MPARAAVHAYTDERLNCAQSVLKAFQERRGLPQREIDDARTLGGGRAAGGVCGALHAALRLVEDPERKEALRQTFAQRAGSERCREIRKAKLLSCEQCVEFASELVESPPHAPRRA
jgi:hypothetical protein